MQRETKRRTDAQSHTYIGAFSEATQGYGDIKKKSQMYPEKILHRFEKLSVSLEILTDTKNK